MMSLIARWAAQEDATLTPPSQLQWQDGTLATIEDYRKHIADTHTWILHPPSIIERHIYPDTVADVCYDTVAGTWAITGPGITPASLDLKDPDATDDQITTELYTFPIIYRARIHRLPKGQSIRRPAGFLQKS